MNEDPKSSREARAKRLISLRKMTRMSKQEFATKHDIPPGNFQNWEGPRYGGLTETGAKKMIHALRDEGILCTLEWLMHGIGTAPQITEKLYLDTNNTIINEVETFSTNQDEQLLIAKELALFRQHYTETLELIISDDAMEPYYKIGEYIAGKRISTKYITNLINKECLVQLTSGEILLRTLKSGNKSDRYSLACINIHSNIVQPVIYDVELISAAPIMWIRRQLDTPRLVPL